MSEYDVTDPVTHKPRMCREMCDTCILRPGSTLTANLRPGRLKQLISEARQAETFVVCHSTFNAEPAICKGFADTYSTNYLRILGRIGGFVEVDPPSKLRPLSDTDRADIALDAAHKRLDDGAGEI